VRIFVYIGSFPENVTWSQHPGIPGDAPIRQCSIAIRARRSYDTCTAKPWGTAFIFLLQCSARAAGSVTVAASAQRCINIGRQASGRMTALRPDDDAILLRATGQSADGVQLPPQRRRRHDPAAAAFFNRNVGAMPT
jgi:hypothetical protein